MTSLLSTLIAIIGYQSGYFWPLLFVANAICRYNCNRLKSFLLLSLGIIALFYVFAYSGLNWSINMLFISQATLCGLSFAYNIYKYNWNRDYLFFWMEPILGSTFLLYFFSPVTMMQNLKTFFIIYLSLQAFVALWDILGLKKIAQDSRLVFTLLPNSPLDMMMENIGSRFKAIKVNISKFELFKHGMKRSHQNVILRDEYVDYREKSEQEKVTS